MKIYAFTDSGTLDSDNIYQTLDGAFLAAIAYKGYSRRAFQTIFEVEATPVGSIRKMTWDDSDSGEYVNQFDTRREHYYTATKYEITAAKPLGKAYKLNDQVKFRAKIGCEYEIKTIETQEAARARWYQRRQREVPVEPHAAKALSEARELLALLNGAMLSTSRTAQVALAKAEVQS